MVHAEAQPAGLGPAVSIGILRTRAVDMVEDARSQDALLLLLLVLFYPGWLLPGWPDKSHYMVTLGLSNSLAKALPRSRHTETQACCGTAPCLPSLDLNTGHPGS